MTDDTKPMGTDLVLIDKSRFAAIKSHVSGMNEFVQQCMVDSLDYGLIPGVKNKVLLKQGAEKICQLLNVAPTFDIETKDLPNGHREYIVKTALVSRSSGLVVGGGVGSCSTMEKKYRWRKDYSTTPPTQIENPDPADQFNTALKMAKKRSLVDSVITLGVCGGMFTQDLEEEGMAPQTAPKASKEAPTGQYVANIPYNNTKARDIAKGAKWRFDSKTKLWSGSVLPNELREFLVGQVETRSDLQMEDDLPPEYTQEIA